MMDHISAYCTSELPKSDTAWPPKNAAILLFSRNSAMNFANKAYPSVRAIFGPHPYSIAEVGQMCNPRVLNASYENSAAPPDDSGAASPLRYASIFRSASCMSFATRPRIVSL